MGIGFASALAVLWAAFFLLACVSLLSEPDTTPPAMTIAVVLCLVVALAPGVGVVLVFRVVRKRRHRLDDPGYQAELARLIRERAEADREVLKVAPAALSPSPVRRVPEPAEAPTGTTRPHASGMDTTTGIEPRPFHLRVIWPVQAVISLATRTGALVWWIANSGPWSEAYSGFLLPAVGVAILPCTTMAYVLAAGGPWYQIIGFIAAGFALDWLVTPVIND